MCEAKPFSPFSLQNHFPQVLLAQRTTQDLFLTAQKEQAWGGSYYSAEMVEERSDYSSDYDLGFELNIYINIVIYHWNAMKNSV
jgi:hypothetical protein